MLQTTFGSAAPSDIPHLVRLLGLLFTQEPEFSPNAEKQSEALDAILHDRSRGRIFVAREAGKVVGMASLLYTISTAEGGKAACSRISSCSRNTAARESARGCSST